MATIEEQVLANSQAIEALVNSSKNVSELDPLDSGPLGMLPNDLFAIWVDSLQTTRKLSWDELVNFLNIDNDTPPSPIDGTYATMAAMFADQGNQTQHYIYYVLDDGSGFEAYFNYLGGTVGNITDYSRLSDSEVFELVTVPVIRVFRVNTTTDTLPISSDLGKVDIEYNVSTSFVEKILFDISFSKYLTGVKTTVDNKSVYLALSIYNKTQNIWLVDGRASLSVVNTDYISVDLSQENITRFDLSEGDIIEVVVGSYGNPLEEGIVGTAVENVTLAGSPDFSMNDSIHKRYELIGNITGSVTDTPEEGFSNSNSMVVNSDTTESFAIINATHVYGEYDATGVDNLIHIICANTPIKGLEIHVIYDQPTV